MAHEGKPMAEKPSGFWAKVYISVIVVNVIVIVLLWSFSRYFR
jgi:hypothetical protein